MRISDWSSDVCSSDLLTRHDVLDLASKFEDYGCEAIIYTDIGRDGMLSGVNIEATVKLAQHVSIPIIASGGVTDLKDIEALCAVEEIGRASCRERVCRSV